MLRWAKQQGGVVGYAHSASGLQIHPPSAAQRGSVRGLAYRWYEGGVKDVGVNTDAGVVPEEELFFQASMAIRLGLDEDVALRGITINGAKAVGIQDRIGSLEEGKDADVVIWTGDPFDVRNHVVITIVNGKIVYDTRTEPRRF